MKNSDKNRDPERARKRAVSDARCALRKLGVLGELAEARFARENLSECARSHSAMLAVDALIDALNIKSGDR